MARSVIYFSKTYLKEKTRIFGLFIISTDGGLSFFSCRRDFAGIVGILVRKLRVLIYFSRFGIRTKDFSSVSNFRDTFSVCCCRSRDVN